ncbi:MAG: nitroreductase family protein [Eubacteriales bacterium]|nr:nitroreductase family protein [Eubacteriales bacterium]
MEFTDVIAGRHSIRRFRQEQVPTALLEQLIAAAVQAPTASNLQAWRFLVAVEPSLVHKLDLFSPGLSGNPPVIIAVCSDLEEVSRRGSKHSLEYGCMMDAAMAAENLMLKAVELGLGTCAIKSYHEQSVRRLLKLPDTLRLELLISVGWPEGEPRAPQRKPMEQVLFFNEWEETK